MTVEELIEILRNMPPEAKVQVFNPTATVEAPVEGVTLGIQGYEIGRDDRVYICT